MDPALQQLTLELADVFETALAVEPPGGLPDRWQAVLDRFGVPALDEDDDERFEMAVRLGLARGAMPGEVLACVRVVVERFLAAETARGGDVAGLTVLATQLTGDAEPRYLGYATWRPKSMFAHAIQTAHDRKGMWARPPGGYVMRCPQCGGPRLDDTLACAFCASKITG